MFDPTTIMKRKRPGAKLAWAAAVISLAAGCAVGPNYKRPETNVPAAFKEAAGWQPAAPNDTAHRESWWEVFQDPVLNELESQVASSNQSLKVLAANYEESRQVARAARIALLPTVSAAGSAERSHEPNSVVPTQGTSYAITNYTAELQATWELDLWGRLRRTTEADVATAQAAAADFAAAQLSTEAALAQDYVQLRILDEKKRLFADAVAAYQRTVSIAQNKYAVGVAARSDVISAQTQLDSTRAQLIDVGVLRAQMEHAIAVLIGKPPSEFSLAPRPDVGLNVPEIPGQVPSGLLQRRPDIASSERQVAAANAKIGIQTAAYFPDLSLSGAAGFEGHRLENLFTAPFRFWSMGAQASDALLDWGQRHDVVREARAAYEGSVANYRQTVLSAFQQVEDNLSGLRILAEESQVEDITVSEATESSRIALNEYNAGTVDFTTVASAQVIELNSRETALSIRQSRLNLGIALIEALGGGWSSTDLPGSSRVLAAH
jgi:NodT family efflux transporter outer membrane factor (OMF) lipoprotein